MKVIGARRETSPMSDQAALARTAALVRGTPRLAPKGVYRFATFEEADAWLIQMMLRTRGHQNPTT